VAELAAAWATILALPVGAIALSIAAWQAVLSRRAVSAQVVLATTDAFARAWDKVATATDPKAAFGDLVNLMEAACAVYHDGMLTGRSGKLLRAYLVNVLEQFDSSQGAREALVQLLQTDDTFDELRLFFERVRPERKDLIRRLTAGTSV
jgi:hypothetical protein